MKEFSHTGYISFLAKLLWLFFVILFIVVVFKEILSNLKTSKGHWASILEKKTTIRNNPASVYK